MRVKVRPETAGTALPSTHLAGKVPGGEGGKGLRQRAHDAAAVHEARHESRQRRRIGKPAGPRRRRKIGRVGLDQPFQRRLEAERGGKPVVDRREPGKRVADIVGDRRAAIVDGDPGITGAEQDLAARFDIHGVPHGRLQRDRQQAKRRVGIERRAGMGVAVGRRLEGVHEGVEPAPGGEVSR